METVNKEQNKGSCLPTNKVSPEQRNIGQSKFYDSYIWVSIWINQYTSTGQNQTHSVTDHLETVLIMGLLRPLLWYFCLACKTNTPWLKDKEELAIWAHLSAVLYQNTNTSPVRAQPQLPASSKAYGKFQLGAGCGVLTRPLALASLSKHRRLSMLCNIFLKQNLGNKITSSSWLWSGEKTLQEQELNWLLAAWQML